MREKNVRNRALLCDADGTLLESKSWILGAVYFTAKHFNFPVSPDELNSDLLQGLPLTDVYHKYAPHIDLKECIKIHHRHQMESIESIVPFPDVVDTIRELDLHGVKLAIVTTRKIRAPLIVTLKRWNIDSLFGAVICLEDVNRPKPDPEGALLAMRMLKANTENTFFVGDVPTDIQTGKNAGVKTIGALYGFTGEKLREAKADWYIQNFSEIKNIILL